MQFGTTQFLRKGSVGCFLWKYFLIRNIHSSGWHNLFWFSTIPLVVSCCYCTFYCNRFLIHVAKFLTIAFVHLGDFSCWNKTSGYNCKDGCWNYRKTHSYSRNASGETQWWTFLVRQASDGSSSYSFCIIPGQSKDQKRPLIDQT